MKIISLAMVLLFASGTVFAKTASDAAVEYFNVLKQKDYQEAAASFDPTALKEFRDSMDFIYEIPDAGGEQFFTAFFGQGSSKTSVQKMSDVEFFASFLRAVMARAESAGGLNFDGMEILGEVPEGESVAHVLTRNRVSVGEMEIEAMEVISFTKRGSEWKALMSGKMKGLANQIKAALRAP